MENDVFVLILGATDGAYALAHTFFHDYGVRVTVMDREAPPCLAASRALTFERVSGMEEARMLLLAVERFYERHSGKSLFLFATKAEYADTLDAHRDRLEKMFFLPRVLRGEGRLADARGLLFAYRTTEGEMRTAYGQTAAWLADGTPAVLLARAPLALNEDAIERGSFALLAEDENENFTAVKDPLSSALFFLTAADVSLPELLVTDYVLCEGLPPEEWVAGLYSLCPYPLLKKRVLPSLRAEADKRYARRLATALFFKKREKGLRARLLVTRHARRLAKR